MQKAGSVGSDAEDAKGGHGEHHVCVLSLRERGGRVDGVDVRRYDRRRDRGSLRERAAAGRQDEGETEDGSLPGDGPHGRNK